MPKQINISSLFNRIDSGIELINRMIADLEASNEATHTAIMRLDARVRAPRYRRCRKGGAL
jgi:hypothetical protein